jgi:surface carbohydrate biosynthesis protein
MARSAAPVIIPVENQVREFDPKLLLACVAARREFPAVIGSRREIDFGIASFSPGFYLSKSLTVRSLRMFRILRLLGHEILAWDEEALVHLPPDVYYSRRLSPATMPYVSHLLAWGEDNVELLQGYPARGNIPIHATGNPRNDFLRPELRAYFDGQVRSYRERFGEFILVNTNFNHVNSFYPGQNLFLPVTGPGEAPRFGRSARGMTRDYARGLHEHKQALFDHFLRLIPALERDFPDLTVVVRPHPTENHEVYREIATRCDRVRVTNEGNVVPWLLASRALLHNGCTTGVEAYVLGVPAVSFRPHVDERYDDGFYRLPNRSSHQCLGYEELAQTLRRILAGGLGAAGGAERKALVDRYLSAQDGPLAVERIVGLIEEIAGGRPALPRPPRFRRLEGRWRAAYRRWKKRRQARTPGAQSALEFHRHRYPPLSLAEVEARLARLQKALRDPTRLRVREVAEEVFLIERDDRAEGAEGRRAMRVREQARSHGAEDSS